MIDRDATNPGQPAGKPLPCLRCAPATIWEGSTCGCRCDCHARGFALLELPPSTIEPADFRPAIRGEVFANLFTDRVVITGPADRAGRAQAGVRLTLTTDEVAWRATRGLMIRVPPSDFQAWMRVYSGEVGP